MVKRGDKVVITDCPSKKNNHKNLEGHFVAFEDKRYVVSINNPKKKIRTYCSAKAIKTIKQ